MSTFNIKKYCILLSIFISIATICMDSKLPPKAAFIYSHGLGETSESNDAELYKQYLFCQDTAITTYIPSYQDGGAKVSKLCLYTRPSVIAFIKKLKQAVVTDGNNIAHIMGRSCGCGTVTNGLYMLKHYQDNTSYFKDTGIRERDAKQIIEAVDKGSLILHVPFLALETTSIVTRSASFLSYCTLAACAYVAPAAPILFPFMALGVMQRWGSRLRQGYIDFIPFFIQKWISNDFDRYHIKPLQALTELKGTLQCPIFVHVASHDEVLNFDDHLKTIHATFGEKRNYRLMISEYDKKDTKIMPILHDDNPKTFLIALCSFGNKNLNFIKSDDLDKLLQNRPTLWQRIKAESQLLSALWQQIRCRFLH